MNPLTAEEIAELHRWVTICAEIRVILRQDTAGPNNPPALVTRLLDEVEVRRAKEKVDIAIDHLLAERARDVSGCDGDINEVLKRLLDEVERSRGTDHPESEPANYGATALDTLNLAPFTPGGRFLFPRAYNQIHAELKRFRALLKRIEWGAHDAECPECGRDQVDPAGHRPDCELDKLLRGK